jgi:D-serine deaminase-like pyridoxal phosphate-dependent protein
VSNLASAAHRRRLAARLDQVVAALPASAAAPAYVVDLDAFDANADDLVRRAAGTPIRVASKSVRVPALLTRVLARPGFRGVLAYSLREALWLLDERTTDDLMLGYPVTDPGALGAFLGHPTAVDHVTLMVDDPAHLDLVDRARTGVERTVRVALDVDAGLKLGRGHVGVKRSPLFEVDDVLRLAREVLRRPGFRLTGVMTYEGQVAGLPDDLPNLTGRARSVVVRRVKDLSLAQLHDRRREVAAALAELVELELWNAGGSGSVDVSRLPPATEVTAGSGLLVPTLFDHYRSFEPRPAAYFGLRVARKPSPDVAVVSGGGLVASGPAGRDRLPVPWAPPGLNLTALEGAGEVQTPLVGHGAAALAVGDWVWFRHAKAGEIAEHTPVVHLLAGGAIQQSVPTYRGCGKSW